MTRTAAELISVIPNHEILSIWYDAGTSRPFTASAHDPANSVKANNTLCKSLPQAC